MSLPSNKLHTLSLQVTCWVVGFTAVVWVVILLLLNHFSFKLLHDTGLDDSLMSIAITVAVVSMVVLAVLIWWVANRYLHPLDVLADSAHNIASDTCSEMVVSRTEQRDEIGQLQNNFVAMQQVLNSYMTEMRQKRDRLAIQNKELKIAYDQLQQADNVKTDFLRHMSVQMLDTVETIDKLTTRICDHHAELSPTDMMKIKIEMMANEDCITRQLEKMLGEE